MRIGIFVGDVGTGDVDGYVDAARDRTGRGVRQLLDATDLQP